jgi:hypothetical protein
VDRPQRKILLAKLKRPESTAAPIGVEPRLGRFFGMLNRARADGARGLLPHYGEDSLRLPTIAFYHTLELGPPIGVAVRIVSYADHYARAALQATNDRGNLHRGMIVRDILSQIAVSPVAAK